MLVGGKEYEMFFSLEDSKNDFFSVSEVCTLRSENYVIDDHFFSNAPLTSAKFLQVGKLFPWF